jgi:hypothetical protein
MAQQCGRYILTCLNKMKKPSFNKDFLGSVDYLNENDTDILSGARPNRFQDLEMYLAVIKKLVIAWGNLINERVRIAKSKGESDPWNHVLVDLTLLR